MISNPQFNKTSNKHKHKKKVTPNIVCFYLVASYFGQTKKNKAHKEMSMVKWRGDIFFSRAVVAHIKV